MMDRKAILRRLSFAAQLPEPIIAALAQIAQPHEVERGTLITLEGTPAEAMYVVAEGRVKVVRHSLEGREQILHVVEPVGHLNTVPMFDGGLCPATAEAQLPTTLLVITREHLLELVEREPLLGLALLREFCGRMRMLVGLVEDLALHTVHHRLAKLLLANAEAAARGQQPRALTQAEMASMIGTVREMVGRALKSFEAAELITLERGTITILDYEGLRERAETD